MTERSPVTNRLRVRVHSSWLALLLVLAAQTSRGTDRASDLKLVWSGPGVAYLAAGKDSVRVGDRISLADRGREVARGSIEHLDEGGLALARLESGSAGPAKRWSHVRVFVTPASFAAPNVMRVGLPSWSRPSAFFRCANDARLLPPPETPYRMQSAAGDSALWIRMTGASGSDTWPETLLVRAFDEAGDEEIALERGDLDAAVFWPGEMSSHLRTDSRGWDGASGLRDRGVVVALAASAEAPRGARLANLNSDLFRGDLAGWDAVSGAPPLPAPSGASLPAVPPRLNVDASWPGRARIEAWSTAGSAAVSGHEVAPLRLIYADVPVNDPDSLLLAIADRIRRDGLEPSRRSRADSLAHVLRSNGPRSARLDPVAARAALARLGATPLFAIRCPVAAAWPSRSVVRWLGPDRIVRLLECRPPSDPR